MNIITQINSKLYKRNTIDIIKNKLKKLQEYGYYIFKNKNIFQNQKLIPNYAMANSISNNIEIVKNDNNLQSNVMLMAGHNKWSKIKHKKEAQDQKTSKTTGRLLQDVIIAVKSGGSQDPNSNSKLRLIIEKCKKANIGKEKIQNAIERASKDQTPSSSQKSVLTTESEQLEIRQELYKKVNIQDNEDRKKIAELVKNLGFQHNKKDLLKMTTKAIKNPEKIPDDSEEDMIKIYEIIKKNVKVATA